MPNHSVLTIESGNKNTFQGYHKSNKWPVDLSTSDEVIFITFQEIKAKNNFVPWKQKLLTIEM